jgi:hypothetical protein
MCLVRSLRVLHRAAGSVPFWLLRSIDGLPCADMSLLH